VLLYYITDRTLFPGGELERRERLLANIAEAARCGIDYVQLREKDLATRDLEQLAREAMERIRASGGKTRLLINSRPDVALAAGADGIHLRSKDVSPEEMRKIWRAGNGSAQPIVAVSCHTEEEVLAAEKSDADFVVFGPMFGKPVVGKKDAREMGMAGLDLLHAACRIGIPVFALGGVTAENAAMCMAAGAEGIAGIRLFQESALSQVAAKIRR
jgi:thiamine-phosphate pyrophosphorylase